MVYDGLLKSTIENLTQLIYSIHYNYELELEISQLYLLVSLGLKSQHNLSMVGAQPEGLIHVVSVEIKKIICLILILSYQKCMGKTKNNKKHEASRRKEFHKSIVVLLLAFVKTLQQSNYIEDKAINKDWGSLHVKQLRR